MAGAGHRAGHGTRARYQRQGCRCGECRAANTGYQRAYRARARAGGPVQLTVWDACEPMFVGSAQ